MLVKQLVNLINTSENNYIVVFPTNYQLGISPGNFTSISLYSRDKLEQIADEQILSISVINNLLSITI